MAAATRFKILEVALRTLNACCLERQSPAPSDEACLRQIAGDHTAPIDELACRIIQGALRLPNGTPSAVETPANLKDKGLQSRARHFELTSRETEVLLLIAQGLTGKAIARHLGISFKTAVCHRYRIMSKLDVHETASLVRYAIRQGIIEA